VKTTFYVLFLKYQHDFYQSQLYCADFMVKNEQDIHIEHIYRWKLQLEKLRIFFI